MFGELRVANDDDVYKILNNDRLQMQAMQDLARYGPHHRSTRSPRSCPPASPSRAGSTRSTTSSSHFYDKHFETRGGGGETFIAFLQNFIGSAIREAYRAGETGARSGCSTS